MSTAEKKKKERKGREESGELSLIFLVKSGLYKMA